MQHLGDGSGIYPAQTGAEYIYTNTMTDSMAQGGVVGGETGQVDDVQSTNALGLSHEEFLRLFTSAVTRGANTALSAVSPPDGVGDHIEHGGASMGLNHNHVATEGPSSTCVQDNPLQAPHTPLTVSTPALSPDLASPSPSLAVASPSAPPVTGDVSAQDNWWENIDWDGPMIRELDEEIAKLSGSATMNHAQDAPRAHTHGRYEPYRKSQAVATGADLSEQNEISTDAAFAGGVPSNDAGGITSAHHSAAQVATAPTIVPSHAHGDAVATQGQAAVANDRWSSPTLEATMAPIVLHSLDAIRHGHDADKRECSFMLRRTGDAAHSPCSMRFKTKTVRDRHVQSCHLKTLSSVCGLCDKHSSGFSRGDALLRHMKNSCPVTKRWKKEHGEEYVKAYLRSIGYKQYKPRKPRTGA
ncbi:unnamed protein product [Peniophora sp. CBMAI 1063]|nr:unnamed protein product [Peniophora sp. CBMAI 1063]